MDLPKDYIDKYPEFSWSKLNNKYYTNVLDVRKSINLIKNKYYQEFDMIDPDDQEAKQNYCHNKDCKIPPYNNGSLGSFYKCVELNDI